MSMTMEELNLTAATLPVTLTTHSPEETEAVGAALASVSKLAGVARGRARISVSHPAVRYEITRLKPHIIKALNKTLGMGSVKSLIISGS